MHKMNRFVKMENNAINLIYADIELINAMDELLVKRNVVNEIRSLKVKMKVTSGVMMMAINETIQSQLDLPLVEMRKVQLADSRVVEYQVVGPVNVRFKNRKAICSAFVLPGDSEPLLGAIPMEEMDVLIHPLRQELIVNPEHPNYAVLKMK